MAQELEARVFSNGVAPEKQSWSTYDFEYVGTNYLWAGPPQGGGKRAKKTKTERRELVIQHPKMIVDGGYSMIASRSLARFDETYCRQAK